jgi:hypothetical protein
MTGGDHPDWDFDGDEPAPQEFPAESTALAPLPRDADGKIVRLDWSDGPKPPPPDADFEPYDPNAAGRAIVNAVNGDAPGSFDELHPNVQAIVRDQEGYDQTLSSIETVRADLGERFAEAESDFEELPVDAQKVVYALLSHDWKPHGAEVLADAYDQLSDILPLTSSAELREFLEAHGFIEG